MKKFDGRAWSGLYLTTVVAVLGVGVWLRWSGMFNDLWLDEIWALTAVTSAEGLFELARNIEFDGFASLYTPLMYLIESRGATELLRLPSFAASSFTLLFVFLFTARSGRMEGLFALSFFSLSFVMVLYGSEARAYGAMVLFAVLSFFLLKKCLIRPKMSLLILFWSSASLAFLFHLSFAVFFLALMVWSITLVLRRSVSLASLLELTRVHSAPLLVFLAVYFLFVRHLPSGGGSIASYPDVIISAVSVAFGGPLLSPHNIEAGLLALALVAVIWMLVIFELVLQVRERNFDWVFYFVAVLMGPALMLIILQPPYLAVRYFLPSIIALYLLASAFLARLFRQGAVGMFLSTGLIALFAAGNYTYLREFEENGRGRYLQALQYIAGEDPGSIIFLAGDHDFRNETMVRYYAQFIAPAEFKYVRDFEHEGASVNWYLLHTEDRQLKPTSHFTDDANNDFELLAKFPHTALSGWTWYVYRRVTRVDTG